MANPNNKTMLLQAWSQLNDKGSWLFTHMANILLDTKIPVMGGTKGQQTTLRTELAWMNDNFKALHTLAARFQPAQAGKEGVRAAVPEGDLFGVLRRTEFNTAATNATIQSLVKTIATMSEAGTGAKVDQAALLQSIEDLLDDQFEKKVGVEVTVNTPVAAADRALVAGPVMDDKPAPEVEDTK